MTADVQKKLLTLRLFVGTALKKDAIRMVRSASTLGRPFSSGWAASKGLSSRGFTMIEALLTVSLVAVLSISIFRTLHSGLQIWERNRYVVTEQEVALFFEQITHELHNSFSFSGIPFVGREQSIGFATIVTVPVDPKIGIGQDAYVRQIGRMEYYFDPRQEVLYRREANYSQAISLKRLQQGEALFSVKDIHFDYFFMTRQEGFLKTDIADALPSVIQIRLEYLDPHGQSHTMTKIINIPSGVVL